MVYRVSYGDDLGIDGALRCHDSVICTEYFRAEHEALGRARELLDRGEYHSVEVCDGAGNILAGVRLQLKLRASVVE